MDRAAVNDECFLVGHWKECGGESRVFGYADIISGGLSYITACLL
jgi:hypothetical protein